MKLKTKEILTDLINDNDAVDVIIKQCFIDAYTLFIKGYEDEVIKEEFIGQIKNLTK